MATVQIELRPFEVQIINDFKTFSPTLGGGKSRPRKGVWIKAHLQEVKEDFVYSMWQRWKQFAIAARFQHANLDIGTYGAFRTYVYTLKKHHLIIPTRRERARTTDPAFRRQYYVLNLRLLESPLWLNPFKLYPGWQKWYKQGFPRPKKKKKVKIPMAPAPRVVVGKEELKKMWSAAERFLRAQGYTLTRAELETLVPDWDVTAYQYKTFKERVGYVIHEVVEIEEVKRVARRLIDPRMAPDIVRLPAREKADEMQKEWMRAR